MKYTIELTDNQKRQMDLLIEIAHRHIGFNPKLESVTEDTIITTSEEIKELQDGTRDIYYNKGFEEGKKWAIDENAKDHQGYYDDGYNNALEDLSHAIKVYYPLNTKERLKYFGTNIHVRQYAIENPKDLIAMAKAYEERKGTEKINVGDEVYLLDGNHSTVVTSVYDDNIVCLAETGKYICFVGTQRDRLERTGRHFDEVEQVLNKLRGE